MKKLLLLYILFSSFAATYGQESIIGDMSPAYLNKIIETGKANYPKFKWTTAKVNSSQEAYDKTKWGVFDFINLSYIYMPATYARLDNNGAISTPLSGYQVGLFVNVGSVLQKPAIIKQAKQELIATRLDKEVIDLALVQEIKKRYFIYVQSSNILKLKTKALADADDVMKHVKYKFEKGEVTFDSYNQALLSLSTYSQDKVIAESSLLIAKSSLEELLGTSLENI